MTISTTTRKAGPFSGNGVTTVFPFVFKVFATSDIQVTKTSTLGVDTVLTLTTNYTVALNADQDSSPGGSVTALVVPIAGEKITIVGNLPVTQPTDITNGSGFYASVVETALDRLTMFVQQMLGKLDRSIKFPYSDATLPLDLPTASLRANKALVFGAAGEVGVSTADFNDQAGAAAASAAAAAASATTASTQAGIATTQATTATTQAATATAQATIATTQAGIATTQATAAAASATTAANLLDNFDDRYLGAKAAAPTLDNDGNALLDGALYFNTTSKTMFVYDLGTTTWKTFTASTLRNGAGVPGAGLGADGDFYINVTIYDIYGPKTAGAWGSGTSLVGPNGAGTGDVLGPAASIDAEVVLFQSTTGKLLKRASITGLAKLASGVLSAATAAVDYALPGLIGSSGITMNTNRLLGRTTAAAGVVEELTIGSNLTLAAGVLDGAPAGITLLAVLTPTAAAAVNALSVFSSTYDSYLIIGEGISCSADSSLLYRFANAGVVDSTNKYAYLQPFVTTAIALNGTNTGAVIYNAMATTKTLNFSMEIGNANDATANLKTSISMAAYQETGGLKQEYVASAYTNTNAVSGISFLWLGGVNFLAQGTIRIYGRKKV